MRNKARGYTRVGKGWLWVKKLCLELTVLLTLLAFPIQAYANSPTFAAYPILPENQISTKAYFDILIKPKQIQDLLLAVENYTYDEITVQIEAVTATTASNGEIDIYLHGMSDSSMVYPFDSLISPNVKTVTIPAKTLIEVPVRLVAPPKAYDGVILGGLCISDMAETDPDAEGVVNKYPSVIPVRLTENPQQHIVPDFQMDTPELLITEQTTTFICDVRNPVPEMFQSTKVSVQLVQNDDVVLSDAKEVDFAPHSVYTLTLVDDVSIEPGNYTANIKVMLGDAADEFLFEQSFVVSETGNVTRIPETSAQRRGTVQGAQDLIKYPWIQAILLLSVVLFVVFQRLKGRKKCSK